MATASVVKIDPAHRPVAAVAQFAAGSSEELSKTLQENHEKHHIFFNARGFHNHIAHHILSLYALGATPEQIRHHYAHNAQYQRGPIEMNEMVRGMDSVAIPDRFMAYLGNETLYQEYISFFTDQVAKKGYQAVMDEFVMADDARAKAMWKRLPAGILHPIIHLGLAIEFDVPAMVAEALAWTAVHKEEVGPVIDAWEAAEAASPADPNVSLMDAYKALQEFGPQVQTLLKDGLLFSPLLGEKLLTLDGGAIAKILSGYRVTEDNLDARIAEAMNVSVFVMLASQRRPYVPKMDFAIMHINNASVYLPAFARAFTRKQAARLVELQIRSCLWEYLRVGAPTFDIEWTRQFVDNPSKQGGSAYPSWEAAFAKAKELDDDGHVAKAVRAMKGAEEASGKQTTFPEPLAKQEFMGMAAVVMRSVQDLPDFVAARGPTSQWVRGAGIEDAWAQVRKVE